MQYNFERLASELRKDEGVRLRAYKDSVGLWTIGVGHLLGKDKRMDEITGDEADALLTLDIHIAETVVSHLFPGWTESYDEVRQRALLNMAFNLGNRLANFIKFRMFLANGQYEEACREMLNSVWAGQVGERAKRLSQMILKGNEYDNRV
jgi:lysozyme